MRTAAVIILQMVLMSSTCAQTVFTDLKSLQKRADHYYSTLAYVKAADLYTEALKKKKNRSDYSLNIKAAALYRKLGRYEEAKVCYGNLLYFGISLTRQDSIEYFNTLRAVGDLKADTIFTKLFSRKILNNLFRDTLYYNIYPLPINSSHSEYCPVILNYGLMFVSEEEDTSLVRRYNALNNGGFAHLYYSQKTDTGWSVPVKLPHGLSDALHSGPAAFYDDNKKLVMNMCLENGQEPYRLGLFAAEFNEYNQLLTNVSPLPFNDPSYSVGHPAISQDGKKLFFVSDMDGGLGGNDIYFSEFVNGTWTRPQNMGPKINTPGDEKYPFLTDDNVLFFSSEGRYGIGGLDIYYVDLGFQDSVAVNMGYPVNSELDDFGFSYDKHIKAGYFSSNRRSKGKDDDLYMYTENKIFLEVRMRDGLDKSALNEYNAEIWDPEMNIPVRHTKGGKPDVFKAILRPAHEYQVILTKENYRNDTLLISTHGMDAFSDTIRKTVYLQRRPVYYASLKLKNDPNENLSRSVIVVNNLTENTIDTLDQNATARLKLSGDCEYIITARDGEKLRYIYVEKKVFRITHLVPYYNLYLGAAKPSILHVRISLCKDGKEEPLFNPRVRIHDWVNRNEFNISPGPEGDFQLVVTDPRLFDLSIDGVKISYSSKQVVSGDYCILFIGK